MATIDVSTLQPVHRPEHQRFEIDLGRGAVAELDYQLNDDTVIMYHTSVPPAYQGLGIAAIITKYALDWAMANGYRINPTCSYVRTFTQRNPEYLQNTIG
jgi:uncharacterized protein